MKKNKNEDLTIMGHLTELRKRLVKLVVVNALAAVLLFYQAELVMTYYLAVNPGMELVFITPSELLGVYVQLSFIMALIVCSPFNGYQIWAFVEKGLYKKEKIYIALSLFFGVFCFVGGIVFCYMIVLPITLDFFVQIAMADISPMISVKSYVSFINIMLLSFGLVFEMPIVVFLLTKLEIIDQTFLKKNKQVLIVLIFIFSAIITPPDVFSQLMLALPMIVLLQISTLISVIVSKSNQKKKLEA